MSPDGRHARRCGCSPCLQAQMVSFFWMVLTVSLSSEQGQSACQSVGLSHGSNAHVLDPYKEFPAD